MRILKHLFRGLGAGLGELQSDSADTTKDMHNIIILEGIYNQASTELALER